MFVRVTWQTHTPSPAPTLRRPSLPARRQADDLGIPPRDFDRMTRGLFDRQG